jgi:hypothetical protein
VPEPDEEAPTATCQRCGTRMSLVGSIPKLEPRSELYTFRCAECGEVETKEG